MGKRKIIFLISSIFISISFLFFLPLSNLLGNIHKNYSLLTGHESTIIIPEPVAMFLLGAVLIAIGVYARRRFLKKAS